LEQGLGCAGTGISLEVKKNLSFSMWRQIRILQRDEEILVYFPQEGFRHEK
jgi:hypothetical protein